MPELEDVRKSEVTDKSKVRKIGLKYPHLRPKTSLSLDEGSEPEVEDESPMSSTTGKESPTEEERSHKKSPPDEERPTSTASDSDGHLSDGSEESGVNEEKLPHRGEYPEDYSAPAPTRPP